MDQENQIKIYGKIDQNEQLTNKKSLFVNMVEYYESIGKDPYNVIPTTFLVQSTSDSNF